MKNILLLFSILIHSIAYSQTITQLEYFIDSDPGFGNATSVNITSGSTLTENITIDLSAINKGFHRIYFRAKDDDGDWSLVQERVFYKSSVPAPVDKNIVRLEYFIDNDPGVGNGTAFNAFTSNKIVPTNFNVDVSNETDGMHTFYIRAKDDGGKWSLVAYMPFTKSTSTCDNGMQDGEETAIDCGGSCPPCLNNDCTTTSVVLNDNPIANGAVIRAAQHIESTGIVGQNTIVVFQANDYILLSPNFHAQAGSTFTATIKPCVSFAPIEDSHNLRTTSTLSKSTSIETNNSSILNIRPNPFSSTTEIRYELYQASMLHIYLHDRDGRVVKTLLATVHQEVGVHQLMLDGNGLEAGMYYLSLVSETEKLTSKVILLK